jgi:hypothetical protein
MDGGEWDLMISKVYLKPVSINAYHRGRQYPLIIGVVLYTPESNPARLCYEVLYEDNGQLDYVPLSEVEEGIYTFITY